jgi:uncharacterized protein (TIGR03435 family)
MRIVPVIAIFLCGSIALAQAPAPPVQFEVAAIKPSPGPQRMPGRVEVATPPGCRGGPSTPDPGRLSCLETMATLVRNAYQLKSYQFTPPDWMQSTWFQIDAKVPAGASQEQMHLMELNLLAERFKLAAHFDKKEMQIYEMTVGKDGQKFKEWVDLPPLPPGTSAYDRALSTKGSIKAADLRHAPNGTAEWMTVNGNRSKRGDLSMGALAQYLSANLERPVIDATGLAGQYDIMLDFVMEPVPRGPCPPLCLPADPPPLAAGPTLLKAVESQLGLKLESKKGMIDILVIDHIEKVPTEN